MDLKAFARAQCAELRKEAQMPAPVASKLSTFFAGKAAHGAATVASQGARSMGRMGSFGTKAVTHPKQMSYQFAKGTYQ